MKKNYIVIIAIVVFILVTAIVIFLYTSSEKKIINITFAHSFTGDKASALQKQIRHYQQINPGLLIEELYHPTQEYISKNPNDSLVPDIFIWEGPIPRNIPFTTSKPILWTGNLWTLIVNPDLLDPDDVEKLKRNIDLTAFSEILERIQISGRVPLSVGNSHNWPLSIWEQHIETSLSDASESNAEPDLKNVSDSRNNAWELIREWYRNEYFLKEVWDEGWARGIIAIVEGKAAMTLMSGSMITTIPAEFRDNFLYLPFPQSGKKSWAIGSGSSITMNEDSENRKEAEKLLAYLTSDAIAQILTSELGTLFYSSEQTSADTYIASWESLANSEEMRDYGKTLLDYVMK